MPFALSGFVSGVGALFFVAYLRSYSPGLVTSELPMMIVGGLLAGSLTPSKMSLVTLVASIIAISATNSFVPLLQRQSDFFLSPDLIYGIIAAAVLFTVYWTQDTLD